MAQVVQHEDVHPDDVAIYEQLAALQGMHNQVGQLRTLLPDKLVEPTRFARLAPPEKVAVQLRGAAMSGSNQIKDFKKAYQSDDIKALFQTVSTADYPQGHDVWNIDYAKSLPAIRTVQPNHPAVVGNKVEEGPAPSSILEKFRELYPDLQLQAADNSDRLPLDLVAGPLSFRIQPASTDERYKVTAKENSSPDANQMTILNYVNDRHGDLKLQDLLSLLASYANIKSTPCEKCQKIIDSSLRLPVARERLDPKHDVEPRWKILHQGCV